MSEFVESPTEKKRKRKNPELWTKNLKKAARNSREAHGTPRKNCTHNVGPICEAGKLDQSDINSKQ